MNAFQRLTLSGFLAVGLLMSAPGAAFASSSSAVVDLSTVNVAFSDDSSGWTVSFTTPSDAPTDAAFLVATNEDSFCTAFGTDTVGDTISCDVPLLDDPSAEPTVSRIDVVPSAYDPATYGFLLDTSSATVVLNGDASGWTITWKTLSDIETGGSYYVVTTNTGETCFADGTGTEGALLSCDLPLLADPSETPILESIRTISVMYDARGALNDGATKYVTTTIPSVSAAYQAAPSGRFDGEVMHDGDRSSTWVWISGLLTLLLSSSAILRRKMVARTANNA
jgi:hypothetical protein